MKNFKLSLCIFSVFSLVACSDGSDAAPAAAVAPTSGTAITDIQSNGSASPLEGQTVTVSGIVTGDFQDNDADAANNLGGFYIQQESPDNDIETSDGLFAFDGNNPSTDVAIGDRVEVTGTVIEHFGETQVKATSVRVVGSGVIQATDVNLPAIGLTTNSDGDYIADLEAYEGMLVRFPQKLRVSNLRFLGRYGEVGLAQGERPFQFTNSNAPDTSAYIAHKKQLAARSLLLDDGMRSSNPSVIKHLTAGDAADYSIRLGDSVTGLTGNLRFSRGSGGNGEASWRLMPTENILFANDNPRPGPPVVAGSLTVSSFNVLNFFSNIDAGQAVCGPQNNQNCRGADSALELQRQLEKTVTALEVMAADIVGLIELENNATESIAVIVEALNQRTGTASYAYVDTGAINDDAIKTGFIYDTTSVQPTGTFALLTSAIDARFVEQLSRPALAQSFRVLSSDAVFTVVVNHLKSKGSSCESSGDPNTSDGQGNCNLTRSNAAAAIADWINTDPTASGDPDFLIIGDLNAYLLEDPLTALKNAGFTSLLESNNDPYSFAFDAQVGALDHAVASPSLVSQVRETLEWHINADEPPLLDYNLEYGRDASLFDGRLPYRASDHDPIIVGLDLTNE